MPETSTDRWFLSDCEGQLVIIREDKLRNVTRDESGAITGYRLPSEWGPDVVITEWDLNTWDAGDDETDDQIRETAARIVADHNEVARLRVELSERERRLDQAAQTEARVTHEWEQARMALERMGRALEPEEADRA